MKRVFLFTFGFLLLALVAAALAMAAQSDNGFDQMVNAIESRYHAHATRIPFMGFASAVAHISTKGGVSGIHVVTFEDFKEPVDGVEFSALVEEKLGTSWKRMIRVTHGKSNEQTLIYERPEGKLMRMVVIDRENDELNLVSVSVDPKYMQEQVAKYTKRNADEGDEQRKKDQTGDHETGNEQTGIPDSE